MYKPHQRLVRIDALAVPGWVSGTLHVALKTSLIATLNRRAQFLALTHVRAGGSRDALGFLALRRDAILAVVPDPRDVDEHPHGTTGTHVPALVRCIFERSVIEGRMQMLSGLRVSDYLETNPGFIQLSDCTIETADGDVRSNVPHVIINTAHVLAVSELETEGDETQSISELVGATA